jgi:hypothetical protein
VFLDSVLLEQVVVLLHTLTSLPFTTRESGSAFMSQYFLPALAMRLKSVFRGAEARERPGRSINKFKPSHGLRRPTAPKPVLTDTAYHGCNDISNGLSSARLTLGLVGF